MWKSSDTLSDQGQNYDAFREEMYKLYPGSSDDVYTVHHLNTLVGQHTHLGIKSMVKLGEFHLQFWAISKYLRSKNRMPQAEQTWSFLPGLQPNLESQVRNQLQIIKPNHNLQDPHDLTDLYNAASFVLQGSALVALLILLPLESALLEVKTETQSEIQALKTVFAKFTEMFKNLLQQSSQRSPGPLPTCPLGEATSKCNFCGVPRHFMHKCEVVAEYMHLSKCKCNVQGKHIMDSHGLCNWYSQLTPIFLHKSYSSQCRLTLRFCLISYVGRQSARPTCSNNEMHAQHK